MASSGDGTIVGNYIGDTRSIGSVAKAVTKRQYLQAAKSDKTLPRFRVKDNSPRRQFPPMIQKILVRPTAAQLKRLKE
jgi:hypothetical protein